MPHLSMCAAVRLSQARRKDLVLFVTQQGPTGSGAPGCRLLGLAGDYLLFGAVAKVGPDRRGLLPLAFLRVSTYRHRNGKDDRSNAHDQTHSLFPPGFRIDGEAGAARLYSHPK